MTQLFEEEYEREEVDEQGEVIPKVIKHDKIFNNDYNTGNLDFEELGAPKVEQEYVDKHMESYYDSDNYYMKMQNQERIDDFFKASEVGKLVGTKKKIPKQLIPRLYIEMKGCFLENEQTEIEFFSILADYFGMSYEIFYDNIPAIYRELILRELDKKYDILKKKGIRKLF